MEYEAELIGSRARLRRLLAQGSGRALAPRRGFTLIELLVVVLIIGILASIAVPQYFKIVEKGRFAEAPAYIDAVKGTQERYLARSGSYCSGAASSCNFDVVFGDLKYFTAAPMTASGGGGASPSWSVSLTRKAPVPAVYGAYVVTFVQGAGLSCSVQACTNELLAP